MREDVHASKGARGSEVLEEGSSSEQASQRVLDITRGEGGAKVNSQERKGRRRYDEEAGRPLHSLVEGFRGPEQEVATEGK